MLGNDDTQTQQMAQDANSVMQASMPDPIAYNPDPSNSNDGSSIASYSVPATAPTTSDNSDFSVPELSATGTPDPIVNDSLPPTTNGNEDLIDLKQKALQHLSPLVGHLDQTPEEKFRTTMMMIQASDDQSLIKSAFEAAQEITDDKARAQALLDVINEINYFTQHHQ